ncbi:hypothetical protein KIW84_030735 [Lathyrus oleraceus]|uniref:Uncharacterized protein n=1 Tax=Pisum sativum TaxID=3888 RepID=A0A9D5AWL7_PEA|nr:hypothetical protein KIW84_030735 [Pisum sativum]
MKLNGDESVRKSKHIALKFVGKTTKAPQVWESKETYQAGKKKDNQKGCFNYKKSDHFIVECLDLQKNKAKNGSLQKYSFKNRFKKSVMATWYELDNKEDSEKDEEQANLTMMALTSSEAEYD